MNLYDTIFTRRSVRRYNPAPLNEAELSEVRSILDDAKQLPSQAARFKIVNADELKGVAAPHAVLAFSDGSDAAMCNIGYTLETLDLYLQSKGYGCLWMGMGKPTEKESDYRVLLAFGKTDAPMRTSEAQFKRKPISQISSEDNKIARAARLAPSAMNAQPWWLEFSPDKVAVCYNGKGLGKLLAGKFQKIDLGIALKFTEIAIEKQGKSIISINPSDSEKDFAVIISYKDK